MDIENEMGLGVLTGRPLKNRVGWNRYQKIRWLTGGFSIRMRIWKREDRVLLAFVALWIVWSVVVRGRGVART